MGILPELVGFCEGGVSLLLGTRDADNRPACARLVGAKVSPDRDRVTVLVPEGPGARVLANLRDNGLAAVTFVRPLDARGMQVKGRCVAVREATADERALAERYLASLARSLFEVGMHQALVVRLTIAPLAAIDVAVEEVFQQTPGPTAGTLLVRTEGGAP